MRVSPHTVLSLLTLHLSAFCEGGWIISQRRTISGKGISTTTDITYRIQGDKLRIDSSTSGAGLSTRWLISPEALYFCVKPDSAENGTCEKMRYFHEVVGGPLATDPRMKTMLRQFQATPTQKTKTIHGQPCFEYVTRTEAHGTIQVGQTSASSETRLTATTCISAAFGLDKLLGVLPRAGQKELKQRFADDKTASEFMRYYERGIELSSEGTASARSILMGKKYQSNLTEKLATLGIRKEELDNDVFAIPSGFTLGKISSDRAAATTSGSKAQ